MLILPVLDLLKGVVVRGVAGKRDEYAPVESVLTTSTEPIDVALALRDAFGLSSIYLADLDAILHREPHYDIYEQLRDEGFELLIDAGLQHPSEVDAILRSGASRAIVGLETWPLLSSLEMLLQRTGPEQLVFSLDLHEGQPLSSLNDLTSNDPIDIGTAVLEVGVRELIVLDLAAVGMEQGTTTSSLCRELLEFAPNTRLFTGGGIRNAADIRRLASENIHGVLVASALHSGAITPADLSGFIST